MSNRKYLPTLSELVDRLSIAQLKEVFIAEHKDEYATEIADIVHDIQLYLKESSRLLEKNVRSFLQFRGANLGMKKTIDKTPEKFIAFNNGLTITASNIITEEIDNKVYIKEDH
jgi:hypothetical protein